MSGDGGGTRPAANWGLSGVMGVLALLGLVMASGAEDGVFYGTGLVLYALDLAAALGSPNVFSAASLDQMPKQDVAMALVERVAAVLAQVAPE